MFFVMIYVYILLPLVYAIFQRRCCRNFIYGCQMCSSVAFRGVCGPQGVTWRKWCFLVTLLVTTTRSSCGPQVNAASNHYRHIFIMSKRRVTLHICEVRKSWRTNLIEENFM
jgi:hypothetical protein